MSQLILILQAFHHFTYIKTHSPTLPSLYLHHSSFSNPSVASPMSQFILQPFFHFSFITGFSLTSPDEPPMAHACSILKIKARLAAISQFKIESVTDFLQSCQPYRLFDRSTKLDKTYLHVYTELFLFIPVL